MTKVHFPREILPLTYVVVALADLLIGGILLVALMARYGITVTPLALWALVAIALLTLWLIGAGLLLSALNVKYRDLGLALPVVLQLWMFPAPFCILCRPPGTRSLISPTRSTSRIRWLESSIRSGAPSC